MRLAEFRKKAINAYYWTSFVPEKRGASIIAQYSQVLDEDLATLEGLGADAATVTQFETKFKSLFSCWLSRKGNCISSMVTGPAKFPVRRTEKANNAEHNAFQLFWSWRERFFKRYNRSITPRGIDVELETAARDLATRTARQNHMKQINALCRKKNATELLLAEGWTEAQVDSWLNHKYDYLQKGYQSYKLSNNLANIKRLEERVEALEKKVLEREKQREGEAQETVFTGGKMLLNYEVDRVQFLFEGKPSKEVIGLMKSNGFNWSPSNVAWQRKITNNALSVSRGLVKSLNGNS